MEVSSAIAVMDKIGGWEEGNEQESQIGARFLGPACGSIPKQQCRDGQRAKEFPCPNYTRLQRPPTRPGSFSVELTFGYNRAHGTPRGQMKSLHYDIEVPCIVQWALLRYSAPSHLNNILVKDGVFQTCHEKTIKKAMERSFTCLFGNGHTPRFTFLVTRRWMMVHCLQGWAWRFERETKEVEPGWTT